MRWETAGLGTSQVIKIHQDQSKPSCGHPDGSCNEPSRANPDGANLNLSTESSTHQSCVSMDTLQSAEGLPSTD